ncbi:sporulation protein YunB [Vallitalea pronyensis]|uniref:Sporulation protein YunB n=1 Tax=Vallitalea pronyensis TaxID=1348613 RepID=A0A8J8MIM6_9FIRM|nr:sporulation protein YunB [Vallitalea pronyensis]QUI21978.1 sporulation protein YunB [Vallitalea pronyensis]
MRRNIKGVKPRCRSRKRRILAYVFLFLSLSCFLFVLTYKYLDDKILPIVVAMSQMKIQTIATQSINDAVQKTLEEKNIDTDELVKYFYNEKGEIISSGIDTIRINQICAEVIHKISEEVDRYSDESIPIPSGNLIGASIFANTGPYIKVQIMPYGTATINYDREFRSTGINQLNHRVWLNIETTMQVVVPLASEKVTVTQQVTLVDQVINGVVPPNYVNVPGSNLLDVAPGEFNKY